MSDPTNRPAPPAGWYADPQGLPQQRWWTGDRWTADVAPTIAPAVPAYTNAPPPTARPAERAPQFALPATPSAEYPTRRQLREQMARAGRPAFEPHAEAPFAMPSAAPEREFATTVGATATVGTTLTAPSTHADFGPSTGSFPSAMAAQPAPAIESAPVSEAVRVIEAAPLIEAAPVLATPSNDLAVPARPAELVPVGYENFVPMSGLRDYASTPSLPPAAIAASAETVINGGAPAFPSSVKPPIAAPAAPTPAETSSSWPFPDRGGEHEVPYQPFGMIPKISTGTALPPDRVLTASAWIIAVLPALLVGAAAAAVTYLPDYYTLFMQGGLAFVFALLGISFATRDVRELRAAGFVKPAAAAWILLTPLAYFVARSVVTRREAHRAALGPLVLWLVVAAAIAAAAALLPDWATRVAIASNLF